MEEGPASHINKAESTAAWYRGSSWPGLLAWGAFALLACLVVAWGLNRDSGTLAGRWQIVSTFPNKAPRLTQLELELKGEINITADGNFIAGRRGLDGLVGRAWHGEGYKLVENGRGNVWSIRVGGKKGRFLTLINPKNQVVVARKISTVPNRTKHD